MNEVLFGWLVVLSVFIFVFTLFLVPFIIIRLPVDYFCAPARHRFFWSEQHPLLRLVLYGIKNGVGVILLFIGVLMLALPGQGILTIITGLLLMNFPGKYKAERWLVKRRRVYKMISWIRRKAGKPDLQLD